MFLLFYLSYYWTGPDLIGGCHFVVEKTIQHASGKSNIRCSDNQFLYGVSPQVNLRPWEVDPAWTFSCRSRPHSSTQSALRLCPASYRWGWEFFEDFETSFFESFHAVCEFLCTKSAQWRQLCLLRCYKMLFLIINPWLFVYYCCYY